MKNQKKQHFWKVIITFSMSLYLINSILFIILGQANADEGWYLYASKLVYSGQQPYRDFAFTQTPLLPYIYGVVQNLCFQSIYLGRITSVIFSSIAFILSVIIAKKHGGEMAGGITSLLGATFTFGIYFQTITKTYALTTFFFMLAFFILTSNLNLDWKLILSTVFVLLATLTRLSALFFAIPFIAYAFCFSSHKVKLLLITLCLLPLLWISVSALQNFDATIWGLVTHHTSQWGRLSLIERLAEVINFRIPSLLISFSLYFFLWLTVLLVEFRLIKTNIKYYCSILITTIGLLLFSIPNLISGGFYTEYFVPFVFVSFPITSIAFVKIFYRKGKFTKIFMEVVLCSAMILGLIRGGYYYIDVSGGRTPIDEIKKASAIISENSTLNDKIFVLEALWLAIESQREVMQNMTMAQFSFYDTDTKTANKLHLVNSEIILSYINNSDPRIIVFTDLDWHIIQKSSYYENIINSLYKNYRLIYSQDDFGQNSSYIDIYIRQEEK